MVAFVPLKLFFSNSSSFRNPHVSKNRILTRKGKYTDKGMGTFRRNLVKFSSSPTPLNRHENEKRGKLSNFSQSVEITHKHRIFFAAPPASAPPPSVMAKSIKFFHEFLAKKKSTRFPQGSRQRARSFFFLFLFFSPLLAPHFILSQAKDSFVEVYRK